MAAPWCGPLIPSVTLSVLPGVIIPAALPVVPVGGAPAFMPVPVSL
ncbi:MAG: hypothetical protein HYU99_01775 [Deltaproteobacteria bacterium]|nr:hypothetical protein [Deltaproteobacteria bacterium]